MWKMLPEILVVLTLLLTKCLFLQVMVKNVCLHVRFSSLMTDRAGFFSFPRATYFPRVRTCTSFKVCHVTRKQTSPCSYVVISANEAYDGGVGAHDLLIVSTFFRSHTCFEVPVCSHDGFLGEEEISSSWRAKRHQSCGGGEKFHDRLCCNVRYEPESRHLCALQTEKVLLRISLLPPESTGVFFPSTCFSVARHVVTLSTAVQAFKIAP